MKGSYQMKKMKKACAVLLAVLSVSLLTSAFAQGNPNLVSVGLLSAAGLTPAARAKTPVASDRPVENVTPVASHRPVDLNVGDLQMGPEFEAQLSRVAR